MKCSTGAWMDERTTTNHEALALGLALKTMEIGATTSDLKSTDGLVAWITLTAQPLGQAIPPPPLDTVLSRPCRTSTPNAIPEPLTP